MQILNTNGTLTDRYLHRILYIVCDIIGIGIILYIPIFSHLVALPLYMVDPIKIIVVLIYLFSNKYNALFLSVILPTVSFTITGHPIFPKYIIIILENSMLLYLFDLNNVKTQFKKIIYLNISFIGVKVAYYIIKYAFIKFTLIQGSVIATPILYQTFPIIIINILFILNQWNHKGEETGIY